MLRPCAIIALYGALLLSGCTLTLLDSKDDSDATGTANGAVGSASLSIVASEGGGLERFVLRLFAVDFIRAGGGISSFAFTETDVSLFAGPGAVAGDLVLSGIVLPAGGYTGIRLGAVDGLAGENGSFIDSELTPLEIPGDLWSFETGYNVRSAGGNDFTLVVHAASALLPTLGQGGQVYYRNRPAGYMVRDDRAGFVIGNVAACPQAAQDQRAVYVFRPDAVVRDIRGPAGSENDPLVSFATNADGSFQSPPLPQGDWLFSYTCAALEDGPETADNGTNGTVNVARELRDNAVEHRVQAGQLSQATRLDLP